MSGSYRKNTFLVLWLCTLLCWLGLCGAALYGVPNPMFGDGFTGGDFVNIWVGAKLALAGNVHAIYSTADYGAALKALAGQAEHNFSYPPHILPLIAVFGLLPYGMSFILWTGANLAALGVTALIAGRGRLSHNQLLLTLLSPAMQANFITGQNGGFTAAMLLAGLFLSESSPLVAGMLFGLLTVKPHLGILVPVVLLMRKNRACIASAAATALVLVVISLILWGIAPWQTWFGETLPLQANLLLGRESAYARMMPGLWADLVMLMGMNPLSALFVFGITGIAACYITFSTLREEGLTPRAILMFALVTVIFVPYAFNYDMAAVSAALAIYVAMREDVRPFTALSFGLLWALPVLVLALKLVPVPLSSFILLAGLFALHREKAASPARAPRAGA